MSPRKRNGSRHPAKCLVPQPDRRRPHLGARTWEVVSRKTRAASAGVNDVVTARVSEMG